jgi:hypothetical protein
MAQLPSASTSVQASAGGVASGADLICIMSPCALNADTKPRLFGKAADAYAKHGYCEGVEYGELHVRGTRKPFLFSPLPIATPGVVSRKNTSGNTGSSAVNVTAGSDGVLGEHDGEVIVLSGGTVGTDQILLGVSFDGGRQTRRVRLGTNNSYTPPYFGVSVTFGAGTLNAGDTVLTWHGSAPRSDASGWSDARENLAAQLKLFRTAILMGDLQTDTEASALVGEANTYETENQRFTRFRASVLDRLPLATMSKDSARMSGNPNVTFAEVGASADTATRSAGSFVTDGFTIGDTLVVTGAVLTAGINNKTGVLAGVAASVLTMGTTDFEPEGPIAGVSMVAYPTLTFTAAGNTLTRNRGSWFDDGFRLGDSVVISGTASNNATRVITVLTATVMTFASGIVNETISTNTANVVGGQSFTDWMAAADAEFAPVDGEKRIDLSAGRGRVINPFSGWFLRRPIAWAASIREYQHDLHRTTFYKDDGPLTGWSLLDEENNLAEWDDRVYGGAGSAARFTTARTWSNGPNGMFIALSLTRDTEGSVLSKSHNLDVTNEACTAVQLKTENVVGRSDFILNDDGTATADSLATVTKDVNEELEARLLTNKLGEGPRASKAVWTPATDDDLTADEATLHGVLELLLNGTVYHTNTVVRVR